jgi:hypothetical protein
VLGSSTARHDLDNDGIFFFVVNGLAYSIHLEITEIKVYSIELGANAIKLFCP